MTDRVYTHFQLFCGLGGLSAGISDAREHLYGLSGRFQCLGAIDHDAPTIERYNRYTRSDHGWVVDMFNESQYRDYWGKPPPAGWREITAAELRGLTARRCPDLVCSSPPCRGFSALISGSKAETAKYQALNAMVLRGFALALEAWRESPPALWLLENVPGIVQRGQHYLDEIRQLFEDAGYSVTGDSRCLGEVGGLAQCRRRYTLVARHQAKLPALLYRPRTRSYRTVGQVLGDLPLPGDPRAGVLHAPRRVSWKTAVRLALIEPGKDWRYLRTYDVKDGQLADYALVPVRYGHRGTLGVLPWDGVAGAVTGKSSPTTGSFAVADPLPKEWGEYGQCGVVDWQGQASTVTSQRSPGQGRFSIADPRAGWGGKFRVTRDDESSGAVLANPGTGAAGYIADEAAGAVLATATGSGAFAIADSTPTSARMNNVFRVVPIDAQAPAVTAGTGPSAGGLALADPVDRWMHQRGDAWQGAGHYGVVPWDATSNAVTASASADNGRHSIADPRLPEPGDVDTWVIVSRWGAWHRPFTDLELGVLQSLVTPEDVEHFTGVMEGVSSTKVRQLVGNAVPRAAAREIGRVFLKCLLAAEAGMTFHLDTEPAWALPRRVALLCSIKEPVRCFRS